MHRTKQYIVTAALLSALSLTGCSLEPFLRLAEDYPEEESAQTEESGTETAAAETRSAEEVSSLADDILSRFRDRFLGDPDGADALQQADSHQEGYVTEPAESGGLAVCGYEPEPNPFSDEMLIVPEEIGGQKVTAVGEYGFSGADYAHLVLLPESVTYFGEYAFKGSSVTEYYHRAEKTVMADYCFMDCPQLSHIIFGEELVTLGEYCFDNSGAEDIS
ncbi:MAG: leucine-rich repeat domain-containing protein, partial [Oscillospiraceae bacterium]|nr:leucine-rich repeat domain-containing protein [Oscillospiraceae bacterium]